MGREIGSADRRRLVALANSDRYQTVEELVDVLTLVTAESINR